MVGTNKYRECSCVRMERVRRGCRRQLVNVSTARRMVVWCARGEKCLLNERVYLLVCGREGEESRERE